MISWRWGPAHVLLMDAYVTPRMRLYFVPLIQYVVRILDQGRHVRLRPAIGM